MVSGQHDNNNTGKEGAHGDMKREHVNGVVKMYVTRDGIEHPPLASRADYICYLHETGHFVQDLVEAMDHEVMDYETRAWAYVLTCTRPGLRAEILTIAKKALATYIWWAEATYGDYWSMDELAGMICAHERRLTNDIIR